MSHDPNARSCDVSVVIPVYNEAECIGATLEETFAVLNTLGREFEVLAVNDGSTDGTRAILAGLRGRFPRLRAVTLTPNSGQSAALRTGFRHARGRIVVAMDADGQNDPHDIPRLLAAMTDCDACCGVRTRRRDSLAKRLGSRIANGVRRHFLDDGTTDSGCSLKAIKVEFARDLPLHLRGMHRFIPALLLMSNARLQQLPVNHRPRTAGRSKYTNLGRLGVTVADLRAVRWMQKRHRRFEAREES